ncbi:MAG: SulP family inorganic anion transporter [Propioniciclava sp.]
MGDGRPRGDRLLRARRSTAAVGGVGDRVRAAVLRHLRQLALPGRQPHLGRVGDGRGIIIGLGLSDPESALPGIAAISLCAGAVFVVFWVFKLGFFVNFISKPINAGFMFGLATFIVVSQLPKLLGIDGVQGNAIERLIHILTSLDQVNLTTVGLGVLGLALLAVLPRLSTRVPAGLVMLVVLTLAVGGLGLTQRNDVEVVGVLATGGPTLVLPSFAFADWLFIVLGTTGIVLLGFSEASSVAEKLADEHGHSYHAESDLFAFGVGNLASGLFGGLPGAGSMSSTATNESAGARTQLSTLITAVAALLTALFFGSLLANVPEAALGALIIHAVWRNLSLRMFRRISVYSPVEARIAVVAAAGVLVLDVLYGLLLAMIVSLVWFLCRTTQVSTTRVGASSERSGALVPEGSPSYVPLPDGVVGVRFTSTLFYGNIDDAASDVAALVDREIRDGSDASPVALIDLAQQQTLDYTTAARFHRLFQSLTGKGVSVVLVGVHAAVFDSLTAFAPIPAEVMTVESASASVAIGLVGGDNPAEGGPGSAAITSDPVAAQQVLSEATEGHPGAAEQSVEEAEANPGSAQDPPD